MPLLVTWALLLAIPAAPDHRLQNVLHILDYVAVDYAGAVAGGRVIDEAEYGEMREFLARALDEIAELAPDPHRDALAEQALRLAEQVERRDAADTVALAARRLRVAVIEAYGVRTVPEEPPDLALGRRVYAESCAACHGPRGHGDGRASAGQQPAPSDFHDAARMAQRSLYGLYSTVTLGVEGTAMPSFELLGERERWSVAAAVAQFGGAERANGLDRMREFLTESVAAYRDGQQDEAEGLAIRAYLDGFETVEPSLANLDAALVREIESDMAGLRADLRQGASVAGVERRARTIDEALGRARVLLRGQGLSRVATFTSSFLILLREGLEAILVLAAVMAFVKKAGRREALRYVHAGWIAALGLGSLTWVAATYAIEISGADREVTEGVTALIAAAMLLYVGYWLHSKAYAQAWTRFIRQQAGTALARRTWWAMAAVAFLAVYREIFEIVLFYQALWVQAAPRQAPAFFGGLIAAAVALAALAGIVLRYSVRLPIGPFFAVTSVLLASLAVVFAGQGVAALQEAGVVPITPVTRVTAPGLGVFPTAQTLAAQAAMTLAVLASFCVAGRNARATAR